MRIVVNLDEERLVSAKAYTGLDRPSALLREALKALVEREASRQLAKLGGTIPDIVAAPRRRFTITKDYTDHADKV